MIQEYNPGVIVEAAHNANQASDDAIEALQDLEIYKDLSKHVLAKIQCEIKSKETGKISEAELERRAYASDDWKEFMDEHHEAIRKGISAKIKKDNARLMFDALQSAHSFRKEEMKRLGD